MSTSIASSIRVLELPKGPDEDTFFAHFRGERLSFQDTTAEAHALLRPVYKVEVLAPGTPVSPNGLPIFDIGYRNDDGGPMYGKDSRLEFTAPATGTYYIRLTDSRRTGGPLHAYRLTVAPPEPDYELFVSPSNPNVPRGGRVPGDGVCVAPRRLRWADRGDAHRLARRDYGNPRDDPPRREQRLGDAVGGRPRRRRVDAAESAGSRDRRGPDARARGARGQKVSVVSLATPPDVRVVSVTPEIVELTPGGRAKVTAKIARANGFAGRVPLSVNNLPFRLTVPDIGLNGILITEDQDSRTFEIVADDNAAPVEQTLYVTARVETNGGTVSEHTSTPIRIRIVGRETRLSR